ncbi:uncharacterized protein DS421_17g575860 [Arachis hypogaea]|nr:uncharacterized protein DS421_17g575860 [Arachis hypogaea]
MSVAYLSEPMSIEGSPLPVLDPPAPDCSPIALSVVTSVSGLNKEIQRLIECICQHNQVVADFRKALTMLAKIQDREQQCDRKNGLRCPCWNGIPSKRRLRPEDLQQDDLISQETNPSQHHDPTYVPTVGANFSMDHMPFRSKRSKKSPRNRRSARAKTQPKIPPNLCPSNSCQVDLTGERGGQSRRPRHPRSKSPRHSNCLQKHYNYLALAFNLAYVPIRSMDLAGVELAIATYIFSKDLPKMRGLGDWSAALLRVSCHDLGFVPTAYDWMTAWTPDYTRTRTGRCCWLHDDADLCYAYDPATEMNGRRSLALWLSQALILPDMAAWRRKNGRWNHCVADRTTLLTFGLNERVIDDVITIVATMLSKTSSQHQWFMLTMIMQDALQGTRMMQANMDAVVSKHMRCKVNKVTEMNLVLDGRGRTLTEADVLRFLQVYNGDRVKKTWYDASGKCSHWLSKTTAERPRFSSYPFEEPVVPQQHRLSMDCGVWVLQWMIRGALWAIHMLLIEQTRMRIAIDLVLRSHNAKAIDVVEKAMTFWRKELASSQCGRK